MKQTAVEWFIEQIEILIKNGYAFNLKFEEDFIEEAKDMERQQLIDCGNRCAIKQVIHNRKLDLMNLQQLEEFSKEENITFGEQYYNETFNK